MPLPPDKLAAMDRYLPTTGPLAEVNRAFHEAYESLVAQTLPRFGSELPVIVLVGDDVKLFHRRNERTERFIPAEYHQVKALSHVAFGVQLALAGIGKGKLEAESERWLTDLLLRITSAERHLADERLPNEVHESTASVLQLAGSLVQDVLSAATVDRQTVDRFGKEVAPWLWKNVDFATRAELDRLHATVTAWRQEIGEDLWRAVYVVICDRHQPRYRQAAKQYFQRLLHQPDADEKENRVLYAEGVTEIDDAFDLLARHIIDQQASRIFFGDPCRLQEDILADAAAKHLDRLLPT